MSERKQRDRDVDGTKMMRYRFSTERNCGESCSFMWNKWDRIQADVVAVEMLNLCLFIA